MYRGHQHHKTEGVTDDKGHQDALVATSKYSERTMESALALVDLLIAKEKDSSIPERYQSLKNEAMEIHRCCSAQEKAKRGSSLDEFFAKEELMNILADNHSIEAGDEKWDKMENDLDGLLEKTRKGGSLYERRLSTSNLRESRFNSLMMDLVAKKYVELKPDNEGDSLMECTDPQINAVIKGLSGWPKHSRDEPLKVLFIKARGSISELSSRGSSSPRTPRSRSNSTSPAGSSDFSPGDFDSKGFEPIPVPDRRLSLPNLGLNFSVTKEDSSRRASVLPPVKEAGITLEEIGELDFSQIEADHLTAPQDSWAPSQRVRDFTTARGIEAFNAEIESIMVDIFQKCLESGVIPTPEAENSDDLSLRGQWQEALVSVELEENLQGARV
jgi:hypothetical protein